MMNESGINGRTTDRPPFTPTQWQELEHQALIYKYMVSGVPVPPELIFSIRRSLDSSLVSRLIPHQSIGWGCYQMGFGTKPDPEPGRCRRTDGKKWRCSREAHPDSNRFGAGSSNSYPYPSSPKQQQTLQHASALSLHQNTSTSHFNVLASETDHKDFRSFQGIGERTLFPEASKSFQESPYHHQQALAAAMNDSYHGADIFNKPTRTVLTNTSRLSDQNQKEEEKDSSETKKSIHHFFGEDWAQNKNSSDSWLDLSSQSRLDTGNLQSDLC
ncbi:Growth-regulating factor 5 [Raphanus sativus]|nr:Growth-regulating factor 5 [Raphanus sativus]